MNWINTAHTTINITLTLFGLLPQLDTQHFFLWHDRTLLVLCKLYSQYRATLPSPYRMLLTVTWLWKKESSTVLSFFYFTSITFADIFVLQPVSHKVTVLLYISCHKTQCVRSRPNHITFQPSLMTSRTPLPSNPPTLPPPNWRELNIMQSLVNFI